jgi:hypothetical protein
MINHGGFFRLRHRGRQLVLVSLLVHFMLVEELGDELLSLLFIILNAKLSFVGQASLQHLCALLEAEDFVLKLFARLLFILVLSIVFCDLVASGFYPIF